MSDPATRLEKALVMLIAAVQTQAAMAAWGPISTNHPASTDIKDPTLRSANLQEWEEFRIFYAATVTAINDDTNWVPPNLGLGTILTAPGISTLITTLLPLLAGSLTGPAGGALTALIQAFLKSMVPAVTTDPIPNPGA